MFGGSDEKTPLKRTKTFVRTYMPPDARRKIRYEFAEPVNTTTAYEASIDKFDYLIVFPFTEHKGPHIKPVIDRGTGEGEERISWGACKDIWKKVVTGTDDEKDEKVAHLKKFWKKRAGSSPEDGDYIRTKAWYTIAREAIIDELTTKSGLQCKLTSNGKFVFCRIRAPIKLLEMQADKVDYKLEFRPEIDPGSEDFFNKELLVRDENGELKKEAVEKEEMESELSRDEAMEILERLYKCGKIPPNELGIKEPDENQAMWTNRVHALERIADRVPVFNKYPCYGPFTTAEAKRYLFQPYSSVRGKTIFRSKDRMFLTRSLIDSFFNLEMLSYEGVLSPNGLIPLHDANRGEKLTIEVLSRRWVRFWQGKANEVGAPCVTHEAYAESKELFWGLRPFAQPLGDIREYFGEKIALYFAWLGFYTFALIVPLGLGLGMYGIEIIRGYVDVEDGYDWYLYGYYIFIVCWAEIYRACWARENLAINLMWGTRGFEKTEATRPEFRPEALERSFVTNEHEPTYPEWKRRFFSLVSYSVIVWVVVLDLVFIGSIFLGEYILITYYPWMDKWWMIWASSAAQAVASLIAAKLFPFYAILLNDTENYATQTDYDDAFIVKVATFQIINCYFAGVFTIFGKEYVFDDCLDSCLDDLRVLLYMIVACRTFWSLGTFIIPWTKSCMGPALEKNKISCSAECIDTFLCNQCCPKRDCCGTDCTNCCSKLCCAKIKNKLDEESMGGAQGGAGGGESTNLVDDTEDDSQFMEELNRDIYDGVFYGYSEVALQFGYVCLFSIALPIFPAIALGENWVKVRVDAYKLCDLCRRPPVQICEDIGNWQGFMNLMAVLGIVCSVGIVVFAGPNFESLDFYDKLVLFLGAEQLIVLLTWFLPLIFFWPAWLGVEFDMNPEPDWICQEIDRQDFIVDKFINATVDNDGALTLDAIKGQISDHIDVDAINLYDLRKNITFSEDEYREMEKLEAERRRWNRDLKTAKEQLQVVYKQETFNEIAGVGETKSGLPLGRLNIRLIQIEKLIGGDNFDFNPNSKIKIRISIRGLRAGSGDVVPKLGPRGDSTTVQLDGGKAVLNTSLGPYAPIKTIDAEIVFYVIDCLGGDAIVAVGSVKLRELQEQTPVDKTLSLRVMQKDGTIGNTGDCRPRLFCTLTFQYSKVVPLRNKIYFAQDKLRGIEKELVSIKAGTAKKEEEE